MDTERLRDKWEEVCFLLSKNVKPDIGEDFFELKVLGVIEKLGWREYKGEIKKKLPIPVGRVRGIEADFVLYGLDNKPVIAIEVKRPSEDITYRGYIDQLTSYMRQLKVDLGLLVGNEIHIYYDGSLKLQHDPLLLAKISFDEESTDGQLLIGFIERESFISQKYDHYLKNWIDQRNKQIKIKKLEGILISPATNTKILNFLRNEFADYGQDVIDAAIKEIEIKVFLKFTHNFKEINNTKPPIEIQTECHQTVDQDKYTNFFSDLVDRISKQISYNLKARLPKNKNYCYFTTGINEVHFEWLFHIRERNLGVELHFQSPTKSLNRQRIEQLEKLKNTIEDTLGENLIFQKDWGGKWSRLFVEKRADELTEELKIWAVEKMVALIRLLQPEIEKMKNG